MTAIVNFFLSFFFSFTGSLSPGTINLSAVQLGLEEKAHIAWRLALAAAFMEYFYAYLAARFEGLALSSPLVVKNFHLIAAIVMITLGGLSWRGASRPSDFTKKFTNSGFRRGLLLGILNPLALPFWIGIIAYLKSQHWIDLSTGLYLHSFLLGVSLGVFILLVTVAYLAKKVIVLFRQSQFIKKIPGFILLGLGFYALIRYIFLLNGR